MKSSMVLILLVLVAVDALTVFFPQRIDAPIEFSAYPDYQDISPSAIDSQLQVRPYSSYQKRDLALGVRRRSTALRCPCLHKVCTFHCMNRK